MGNFDFPKVWWGGNTDWWGGGQLPPLAPMVATALLSLHKCLSIKLERRFDLKLFREENEPR